MSALKGDRAVPAPRSGHAAALNRKRLLNTRGWTFLLVLAAVAIGVPWLNATGALPDYAVPLIGKYLCYALLAIALDLLWGYCGILSLGHGAFFALGGYAMGMHLMREIGDRGVYANPDLPDFMVFLNWQELPWFWWGFDSFPFAIVMALFAPGLLAFVFGWFAFRSRVTGVYLSIITQAMTYALMLAFFRNEMGFGGNNGLTDFKDVLGYDLQSQDTRIGLFVLSALAVAGGFLICRMVVISKAGKVIVGVRDAESRMRFLGYRVEGYKLFVFVLSAMLAGLAGALVGAIRSVQVGMGEPVLILAFVVIVIGGIGSIRGALVGALLVGMTDTLGGVLLPPFFGLFMEGSAAASLGSSLASMLIYVLMAGVLVVRPSGLYGGRA